MSVFRLEKVVLSVTEMFQRAVQAWMNIAASNVGTATWQKLTVCDGISSRTDTQFCLDEKAFVFLGHFGDET